MDGTKRLKKPLFRKRQHASQILEDVVNHHTTDYVTFGELMHTLHERGFGLLMAVFVLPNCVPVPIPPGMSTVFSLPLLFLSIQMVVGLDSPWLPEWLKRKRIKRSTLAKMVEFVAPKLKRLEKVMHPRLSFASSNYGERVIGIFWLIFAISIAVPMIMTNFVPGIGILIMSMGLLARDGVTIIAGITVGLAGTAFTIAVLALGTKAAMALFGLS